MMKARFVIEGTDIENKIVYLVDLADFTVRNFRPSMTITNDAESVRTHINGIYGKQYRIVYQDTDDEWWEIIETDRGIDFKPWAGLAWDILSRKETTVRS